MSDSERSQSQIIPVDMEKVRAYAEKESANGFTWVYRAEGELDPKHVSGDKALIGTWFTPSFELAKSHIRKLTDKAVPNPHLIAIIIPKSMLDQRDTIQKGMNEINVIFRSQASVIPVEEELSTTPDAESYIGQFVPKDENRNTSEVNPDFRESNIEKTPVFADESAHRNSFYEIFSKKLGDEGLAYYPGSGSDPIPLRHLGKRVIYGSLRDADYLSDDQLKSENNLGVYTDMRNNPFPDQTFNGIIMHDSLVGANLELGEEFKRLLKPNGHIILENKKSEYLDKWASTLKILGFVPDEELDKYGGITGVSYYETSDPAGHGAKSRVTKEEYEGIISEKTTRGFQIRVFRKTDKVMIKLGE